MNSQFDLSNKYAFSSPDDIRMMQRRLFAEHLDYCKHNSPFYRKLLGNAKVTLEDIAKLPTTSKADLAQYNDLFVAVDAHKIADISLTSGTTGKPCRIVYTARDLERLAYNDATGFLAAGMQPGWRVLLSCTIDRCFIAGLAYYMGVVKLGAAGVRNGINSIESHSAIIRDQKIDAVVGVPSFLVKLFEYMRENKIDFSSVKMAVCIGEPLRKRNMDLTILGAKLNSYLPNRIFSTYASSEIGSSFTECTVGCGGHLPADIAIVEVIDDAGNQVAPGEEGEIAVTPLQVEGMPLVRFRTGDIGFMLDEPCSCGRNTIRLGPIIGRRAQMMKIKGTLLFPNAFFAALDEAEGVLEYLVTVKGRELAETAEVCIAGEKTLDCGKIAELIHSRTRIHVPVTQLDLTEIRRRIYGASRKPVRFFDERDKEI